MKLKPIRLRDIARCDVDDTLDYYRREAGRTVANGFVDALERAFRSIRRHPGTGSPRYASELGIAGLRSKMLARYPYLVVYVEQRDFIDVWRVLDARRDLPKWMMDAGGV